MRFYTGTIAKDTIDDSRFIVGYEQHSTLCLHVVHAKVAAGCFFSMISAECNVAQLSVQKVDKGQMTIWVIVKTYTGLRYYNIHWALAFS